MSQTPESVVATGSGAPPRRTFRHSPALRPGALAVQGGLLLAIAALGLWIGGNVVANVARLNVHTGFDFLWRSAGFDIAWTLIPYTGQSSYFTAFLAALLNTLVVSLVAGCLATILGFVIGLARLSRNPVLSALSAAYVEFVRNVPLLLQLFYWYFAVLGALPPARQSLGLFGVFFLNKRGLIAPWPQAREGTAAFLAALVLGLVIALVWARMARRRRVATGQPWAWRHAGLALMIGLPCLAIAVFGRPLSFDVPALRGFNFVGGATFIPEMVAMILALTFYSAGFIAELVRGAFLSVPKGQTEAALALGLPRWRVNVMVVIPQALRALVPPLAGQYIHLLKNSSLGAAIAFPDLMLVFAGTALNQTGQPLEVMFVTMLTYLLACLAIAAIAGVVNRRVQLVER